MGFTPGIASAVLVTVVGFGGGIYLLLGIFVHRCGPFSKNSSNGQLLLVAVEASFPTPPQHPAVRAA